MQFLAIYFSQVEYLVAAASQIFIKILKELRN